MRRRIVSAALAGVLACTTLAVPTYAATTGSGSAVTTSAASGKVTTTKKTMYLGSAFNLTVKGATKKGTVVESSKKGIVKVSCTANGKYKITAKKAGTVTLTFKDKKSGKVLKRTKITVKTTEDNYLACLDAIANGYDQFSFTGSFDLSTNPPIDPEIGKPTAVLDSCKILVSGDVVEEAIQVKVSFDIVGNRAPEIVPEGEDAGIKIQGDMTEFRLVDQSIYMNYGMYEDFMAKVVKDNPKTFTLADFDTIEGVDTDWVKLLDMEDVNMLMSAPTATTLPEGTAPITVPAEIDTFDWEPLIDDANAFITGARKGFFKRIDAKSSKVFTKNKGYYEFNVNKKTIAPIISGIGTFFDKDIVPLLTKQAKTLKKGNDVEKMAAEGVAELIAIFNENKATSKETFAQLAAQLPAMLDQFPDFEIKLKAKENKGTANLGCVVSVPEIAGGSIEVSATSELKKYTGDTSGIVVAPNGAMDVSDDVMQEIIAGMSAIPEDAQTSTISGDIAVNA